MGIWSVATTKIGFWAWHGSDIQDTGLAKKWLVDLNAGKTQLVPIERSNDTGAIDGKMDGSVLEEKLSFKMLGMSQSSKLDWGSYIAYKKIWALIRSMKFLSTKVAHAWNAAVTSGLVHLVAT